MKLGAMGHSLDRFHVTTFGVKAEHQTRKYRTSIDEHRARATLAQFATVLGAGEIQILTQNFQQRLVRCEGDLRLFAVEGEIDMLLTVERQRLSSSLCSKSCCQSVASCRRTPRPRLVSAARRCDRSFPASRHRRRLRNPNARAARRRRGYQ